MAEVKVLKTLAEHNEKRQKAWDKFLGPDPVRRKPNGIACPQCGGELEDGVTLADGRFTKFFITVHCLVCDWRGERLA